MGTRNLEFAPDEYYHLCNRSIRGQNLFLDSRDRARFLYLVLHGQSPSPISNAGRQVTTFYKSGSFGTSSEKISSINTSRVVDLVSFIFMDNHFHLIVKEQKEKGISNYMMKILDGYTKYFNTKYQQTGHLFAGPFRAVHIKDNDQLLYASAYVHRNARDLRRWRNKEEKYSWSSYPDYFGENRWGELLKPEIVLDQFSDGQEYHEWVKGSSAKSIEELGEEYFKEILA